MPNDTMIPRCRNLTSSALLQASNQHVWQRGHNIACIEDTAEIRFTMASVKSMFHTPKRAMLEPATCTIGRRMHDTLLEESFLAFLEARTVTLHAHAVLAL